MPHGNRDEKIKNSLTWIFTECYSRPMTYLVHGGRTAETPALKQNLQQLAWLWAGYDLPCDVWLPESSKRLWSINLYIHVTVKLAKQTALSMFQLSQLVTLAWPHLYMRPSKAPWISPTKSSISHPKLSTRNQHVFALHYHVTFCDGWSLQCCMSLMSYVSLLIK